MTGVLDHVSLRLVDTIDKAMEFKRWLGERREVLGTDTETGGFSPERNRLRLWQFGDLDTGWAIPWERWGGVALEAIQQYEGPLVLHNSKFDARFINRHAGVRWPWERTDDTMAMAHLIDPQRPKGLKPLSAMLVDPRAASMQRALDDGMAVNRWTWDTVPFDFQPYWIYAALDPVLTCHIYSKLKPQITPYLEAYEIEMTATSVVYDMERFGCRIDPMYCDSKGSELRQYAESVRAWIKQQFGIENPGSDLQLLRYFESESIELPDVRTKGGRQSVAKDVLELVDHPMVEALLTMRKAEKIVGTYLASFPQLMDADGMLHANMWVQGTRTSRMSMSEPNLQNLPRKDPTVRDAFIPRDGNVLITCDYDQIEARLAAHFSEDPGLIEAFRLADSDPDEDFFCTIASDIYQRKIEKKRDKEDRQLVKNTVYGKLYGAGVRKMAATAKVPFADMERVVIGFDSRFPGVRSMQMRINAQAQRRQLEEGEAYINTPTGRRMIADDDKEYTLTNYLIQCHAAEILKRKLGELANVLDPGMMILPVHDEVVFDVPAEDAPELKVLIERVMSNTTDYLVPITASADILSDRWGSKYH